MEISIKKDLAERIGLKEMESTWGLKYQGYRGEVE